MKAATWDSLEKAVEGIVLAYWEQRYSQGDHCTLCGNSGAVDTTGVCTPGGVPVGRKQWCFCPNGLTMRKLHGGKA